MGEEVDEAFEATVILFAFMFNPNECIKDGTKIHLRD